MSKCNRCKAKGKVNVLDVFGDTMYLCNFCYKKATGYKPEEVKMTKKMELSHWLISSLKVNNIWYENKIKTFERRIKNAKKEINKNNMLIKKEKELIERSKNE